MSVMTGHLWESWFPLNFWMWDGARARIYLGVCLWLGRRVPLLLVFGWKAGFSWSFQICGLWFQTSCRRQGEAQSMLLLCCSRGPVSWPGSDSSFPIGRASAVSWLLVRRTDSCIPSFWDLLSQGLEWQVCIEGVCLWQMPWLVTPLILTPAPASP